MSVNAISASYGTIANDKDIQWYSAQLISGNHNPIDKKYYVIDIGISSIDDITLNNCKIGIKNTSQHTREVIHSLDGKITLTDCEIKGIISAPHHAIEADHCLIEGKVTSAEGAIQLAATEVRSQDYTNVKLMSQSGFDEWICPVRDSNDTIYYFNKDDIPYNQNLLKPNTESYILPHIAVSTEDNNIECNAGCKIYGDVFINAYDIDTPTRNIIIRHSMVAGNILNRSGDTQLEKSSAKAIYSSTGVTELNSSVVDFLYTAKSNTLIHEHSIVRHGAILGGQSNEIRDSTINGSLKLIGQTLAIGENSVVDQVCLPHQNEIRRDYIPCITIDCDATLHALETHGQPCHIYISEGGNFTPLNRGESLPANVVIKDL